MVDPRLPDRRFDRHFSPEVRNVRRVVDVVNRQVHKLLHARSLRPFERGQPFLRLRHRYGVQQEQAVDALER